MAQIEIENLAHSYMSAPERPEDYALRRIGLTWRDGGAYALLGPSGCGKTTLLNIVSGLIAPSGGRVLFDGRDVTQLPPDRRNIAQVFQFPVVYDTMTVRRNLAFPLRNRGIEAAVAERRIVEIAEMLELTDKLDARASRLAPDEKQKISMGRGLVREDVNAVMFDEPLTVIDPLLKWKLRSKLKELHQRLNATMIYVTHDQTEALTFADEVVVMQEGEVVQAGTPVELFERPLHTFVGHFIGSPGMNVLPCEARSGDRALFEGHEVALEGPLRSGKGAAELGIRPEHVELGDKGIPARVTRVADLGRRYVVDVEVGSASLKAVAERSAPEPGAMTRLRFLPERTRVYRDGRIATEARAP